MCFQCFDLNNTNLDPADEVDLVRGQASPVGWIFPVEVEAVESPLSQERHRVHGELSPLGGIRNEVREHVTSGVPASNSQQSLQIRVDFLEIVEPGIPLL
ncbi:hypothetical protein DPMN_066113 [Dreissena polymorpha]|uniref:Uncharacterized protein n=1 Tax=Dreissena polymorpha TaxID=45954 RepID=A0A9D3YSW3_DREPO|nr:hypothetical protein DPMN_066113 [Dreissena polymorpha]